jgi:hypothetical protein
MAADPIFLTAGRWLLAAAGLLAVLTLAGFLSRWGMRFRLVGVTSFTTLLAISCLAFSVSYVPRTSVPGAAAAPVVFDNGGDLVIAAAQVARNLRGSGRSSADGHVEVRLRRVEAIDSGRGRPVILARADRDLVSGEVVVSVDPGRSAN